MRLYVGKEHQPGMTPIPSNSAANFSYRTTPSYVEVEQRGDGDLYYLWHLAPRTDHSWWVAANLGVQYDGFFEAINHDSEPVRYGILKEAEESWPIFFQALLRGLNNEFWPPALVRFEDPDIAAPTWMVTSVLGNVPASDDILSNPRTFEQMIATMDVALAMSQEFHHVRFGKGLRFKSRIFFRSVANDLSVGGKYVLDRLPDLIGAGARFVRPL